MWIKVRKEMAAKMKKRGRKKRTFTEKELKAIHEYLESDLSYKEVAEKYNIAQTTLQYYVGRYRKELKENAKENFKRSGRINY